MGLGQLFRQLKEALRDPTREQLCAGLCEIGVNARIAERDRPEEATSGWFNSSLGVIDVGEGPIRWINVIHVADLGKRGRDRTIYGVPDPRYLPNLQIKSLLARKSELWTSGRVTNVQWEGDDCGLGILVRLNNDEAIRSAIMGSEDEIRVMASPDHGCWLMSRETTVTPSADQWGCYQAISEHLLQVSVPEQQMPS